MRYLFDEYVLDFDRRELRRGADLVPVEPQVFDLLVHLIRNRDRVVSKDDLLDAVWHGRIVSESTLFNRINAARSAIRDAGEQQRLIKTLPRKGVRFIGAVEEEMAQRLGGEMPSVGASEPTIPFPPDRPSIAVLPFANLSGDPNQDYFSDGITGDIITELSRFSELLVISRSSSFTYKGKSVDIRLVGKELGARYVLEGSVTRAGDRLRITGQLVDASTGAHRWADRFDRKLDDLFEVQDEVARTIVATIAVHLNKAEIQRSAMKLPATWQAYDYYLQGSNAYSTFQSTYAADQLYAARRSLEKSIALDPDLARAYAVLSRTHLSAWVNPIDGDHMSAPTLDYALELALRAVRLDPNLPQARAALGYVLIYNRQHEKALTEFDKAFALNPNLSEWSFILGLVYSGEAAKAVDIGKFHGRLDPFCPAVAVGFIGFAHYMLKSYEAALAPLHDCVQRAPNFRGGHFWLAATYAQMGRMAEARAEAAEVLRIEPTYTIERSAKPLAAFRQVKDAEHWFDGLQKAGFPD